MSALIIVSGYALFTQVERAENPACLTNDVLISKLREEGPIADPRIASY